MPFDFNTLIITDTRNADAAKKLKTSDPRFSYAVIIEVQTVNAFIDELRKTLTTGVLVLALDGDKTGRIEIDGKPLDLKDLTGVKLRVMDQVFLEGTALKSFTGSATLKTKLKPDAVNDEWIILPELPEVDIESDQLTHEVASTVGPGGLRHFVTVRKRRGGGDVLLSAKLVSGNTAKNRKELKWEAPLKYRVPNNQWAVRISRGKTDKVQIPLKFYGKVITQVVVWVVWCDLAPIYKGGASSLDLEPALGALQQRTTGELQALSYVDWLFPIAPPAIISDTDRPDLAQQIPRKVPGEGAVPDPFCGWELATDVRQFIKKITPGGKHVVLSAKTDPPGMYRWPNGDVDGLSLADEHEDPYNPTAMFYGWPCRSGFAFKDGDGDPGEVRGFHKQARIFARVQLGTTWYRCSDIKRYRHKDSAKMLSSGIWDPEPGTKAILEMNNKDW